MKSLLASIALAMALPAAAPAQDGVARMQLLDGWRENGRLIAGVEIDLASGWKTYWRSPGQAGIPPHFDWDGSRNVESVVVHWPVPEVFEQSGMTSVGYSGNVILPVEILPRDPGRPVTLALSLDMGVCQEICMPVQASARTPLRAVDDEPDARIRAALADRPLTASEAGVADLRCDITSTQDGMRVITELSMPPVGGDEYAVIELDDPRLWISRTGIERDGDRLVTEAEIEAPGGAALAISREALRLTVLGSRGAVEIEGCN